MSESGMMSGAHPTAPGGMSQKALIEELHETHGYNRESAAQMTWPEMIDAVIAGRKAREAEFGGLDNETFVEVARSNVEHGWSTEAEAQGSKDGSAAFEDQPADDDDLDPDALMAELSSIKDEQEAYEAEHGLLIKVPGTKDYIFDGHAGAGPSSSERWMTCTASLQASREFLETLTPNQQRMWANSNIAARQGTTAHAAAEAEARVMLGETTPEEAALTLLELSVLPETDGEAYDDEMGEYITEYTDLIKSYAQERGTENVLIEARVAAAVPLTGMHEGEVYEIPGSADMVVLPTPEEPVLVVGDLKYGEGIWVDVDENSQAMIYALGVLALMVGEDGMLPDWLVDITLHIIQPRMDGIKTAHLTVDGLLTWRDEVLAPALTAALYGVHEGGATFVPTEGGCQFCPARGGCAALAEHRVEQAAGFFDAQLEAEYENGPGVFLETTSLSDERLGELYSQVSGLVDILKDLKAEAERRLYRGEQVPGLQLVNYSPPRQWEDGAEEAFEEVPELWIKKMVTPTQAVKLAEANPEEWDVEGLQTWVIKPDKRPVVAKVGDRRKPWEGRPPEAMFDVIPDENGGE